MTRICSARLTPNKCSYRQSVTGKCVVNFGSRGGKVVQASQAAEKVIYFVIPSEARNLSSISPQEKSGALFPQSVQPVPLIAGLASGDVGHGALVFGEQFLSEFGGDTRVWRVVWRGSALLDRLFQTCQKHLTGLAAIHVLFELFAKGIVQFIVEVA